MVQVIFFEDELSIVRVIHIQPYLHLTRESIVSRGKVACRLVFQHLIVGYVVDGFFSGELNLIYGLYQSVQEGILDESNLRFVETGDRMYWTKMFKQIWPGLKLTFNQDFADYIESLDWNQ